MEIRRKNKSFIILFIGDFNSSNFINSFSEIFAKTKKLF